MNSSHVIKILDFLLEGEDSNFNTIYIITDYFGDGDLDCIFSKNFF